MNEKLFSVGEVAKSTGLTVRALQHYDKIGLLPVSGRTEGGRRIYTASDLLRLEQIVFYKSIGISLDEIKKKLVDTPSLDSLEDIMSEHLLILLKRIGALQMAISVMDASLEVIKAGSYPPFDMLTQLIRAMDGSNLGDWIGFEFDSGLYESLKDRGITTIPGALNFYHTIREILVEAVTLQKTGRSPNEPVAQELAKRWWATIMSTTNGDEAAVAALSAVNNNRDTWPEADRKLFSDAEPFIEAALGIYITENNIQVPEALL